MNQITGLLANKRIVSSIFLLGGVLVFTYFIQDNSQKLKRVTNLESGIQTCFSRVNQTYTAKLLNDQTSQYLTQNFQGLTEECFAEGILNVEENLKTDLPIIAKKISTLASNVHWFHEDSLLPAGATHTLGTGDEGRNIGSRFETIETTKDEILDSAEQYKVRLSNDLKMDNAFFYAASVLLAIMLMFEYIANANRKISNSAREKEAGAELLDGEGIESVKIGEIISVALEQNDLKNCATLFNNFYYNLKIVNHAEVPNKEIRALQNLVTPERFVKVAVAEKDIAKIEATWHDDTSGVVVDKPQRNVEEYNLNQVTANVIDLLAERIFSQGVQLKAVIAEHITIKGREEELEQVFYHLLASAITFSHSSQISMVAQRLGDIVILDLSFQNKSNSDLMASVDMRICQTLLDEINAKIKLDNTLDQLGNVTGTRVKIIFIAGQDLEKSQEKKKEAVILRGQDLIS
jgi:signal transduction histidine kinase